MAKTLADYPRPRDDTGLGGHLSANVYDFSWKGPDNRIVREDHFRAMWDMGMRWVTLFSAGDSQLELAGDLVNYGFEVIARFYPGNFTWDVPPADAMLPFAKKGVHYALPYVNEPEIESGRPPNADVIDLLARGVISHADNCYRAGLIPVTPCIQSDRVYSWFRPMCERVVALGRKDALAGSVIGGHFRPSPYWPPDRDPIEPNGQPGFSFRSHELFNQVVVDLLGYPLPQLGCEAGYEPTDLDKNDLSWHTRWNKQLALRAWPAYHFCENFWIITGHWGDDSGVWFTGNKGRRCRWLLSSWPCRSRSGVWSWLRLSSPTMPCVRSSRRGRLRSVSTRMLRC